MKILITGNLGYVGSELVKELRHFHPQATLMGYDTGFFARHLLNPTISPDVNLDYQVYGDIRSVKPEVLKDLDTVIQLAAVSNDPIGNQFEEVTMDINYRSTVNLAKLAKENGVKNFVFASSCSVYGFAEEAPRTEDSAVNPLTAYAKSKVLSEEGLKELADEKFKITCLRFATACGYSDRLRLDLVLNDFVAGALITNQINILSDGSPRRPLINVRDMGRALRWGFERNQNETGDYVLVNAGSNEWNYQIKALAEEIHKIMPQVEVSINRNAQPDKRSYKVNFDHFRKLAPNHQPQYDLKKTISELIDGLEQSGFNNPDYRQSNLVRLYVINQLIKQGIIDDQLQYVK